MLSKNYINFKTCTCSVNVWMGIICVDVNGLSFVLQDRNVYDGRWYGIGAIRRTSIKLINNLNNRQGAGIAPIYLLLDCFQCSVIKVRCDLNNSNSGHCSICCPHRRCLSMQFSTESIVDFWDHQHLKWPTFKLAGPPMM